MSDTQAILRRGPVRRYDAVFLDAGGTLFRERTSRPAVYCEVLARFGIPIDETTMARHMAAAFSALPREIEGAYRYSEWWFRTFIQYVLASAGADADDSRIAAALFAAFRDPATFAVFDDARPLVKRLKGAGLVLGVVSNWSPSLQALLARLGFEGDFRFVLASALVRAEKPEPAIFRRAIELAGVPAERCLHVGDRDDCDVAGARDAGLDALRIDRTVTVPSDGVISSLAEVARIVGLR
jgi:putative hydrolase of the HAD superfamily